jgi:hypothetical protein
MLPPNSLHAKVGPKLLDMKTRPQLAYDENKVDKKSISSGNRPLKKKVRRVAHFDRYTVTMAETYSRCEEL